MEIGVDIVDLDRIRTLYTRYGMKFLQRFLTEAEIAQCLLKPQVVASIAGRFAAKEAVVKALGTGFSGAVHWKSFEILNDARGAPYVRPTDVQRFHKRPIKISIAHDRHSAVAIAMIDELREK